MTIRLNKTIDLTDGTGRPLYQGSTGLTVKQAAAAMASLDLPAYVACEWQVYADAPHSIAHQVEVKSRRLRALGKACGRNLVRVEPMMGFSQTRYQALLAR